MLCVCLYLIIKNVNEKSFSSISSIGGCDKNGLDRFLECAVCSRGVKLCYLHENYKAHFHIDDSAMKVSLETEKLVKTKSPTRMEVQKQTKNVETSSSNKCKHNDRYEGCKNRRDEWDYQEYSCNAKCLLKTKVVYSNRSEEEEALVFRNLYPCTHFDRFGIKGIHKLKWVFYFIFGMMSEHQTNLLDGRDARDGLLNLIDDLDSEDRTRCARHLTIMLTTGSHSLWKSVQKNIDMYPQLKLMQYGVDVN